MAIHIQDIIEALTRDVHEAYKRIKENDLKVSIPEIEIELNLEVDLDGLEEKMPESTMIRKGVKLESLSKYVVTERILKEKGLGFRRIKTTPHTKENVNFTIKMVFIPEE